MTITIQIKPPKELKLDRTIGGEGAHLHSLQNTLISLHIHFGRDGRVGFSLPFHFDVTSVPCVAFCALARCYQCNLISVSFLFTSMSLGVHFDFTLM